MPIFDYKLKIYNFLLLFFVTQNILLLIMIPLYCSWGIPITLLTFIGNIIFSPFLTIFIFLSLILFLIIIIFNSMPYALAYILKKIVDLWIYILSYGKYFSFLVIYVPNHGAVLYSIFWGISVLFIIMYRKRYSLEIITTGTTLSLFLLLYYFSLYLPAPYLSDCFVTQSAFAQWPKVICHRMNNHVLCYIITKQHLSEYKEKIIITYTIIPEIIKRWGIGKMTYYSIKI